ncbi:MAG: hypothetical protein WD885_00505 [Candidatus Saccharimonadales bacterium]
MIKKLNAFKIFRDQKGIVLPTVLVLGITFAVIGFSLLSYSTSQYSLVVHNTYVNNTINTAEAGIEFSLDSLNEDTEFIGYADEEVLFNNPEQGRGVYTTTIEEVPSSNAKIITSVGKVYRYDTNRVESTRTVKATAVGTGSPGFSVHTGPGGLILGGSANITNSDVFVNGYIDLNGASKIGTQSEPLNVNVANQRCPSGTNPGPTYPQVCTSGEPITMDWSTSIYGTVCATGQTSVGPRPGGNILPGSGGQGLLPGCESDPVSTPTYDKAAQVAAVTTTGAGNNNTYVCNSWPFDRTWPANLRLTGSVNVGGSCNVTIRGDTYITGDLTINGASTIRVDNSVGTDRPVVIVDGKITVGGSASIVANSQGTGIQFISFKSDASCGSNCTSLSGNELKNSQNLETVDIGGAVNLPGMIFQAYWGKLSLAGSGSIGSAAGQTIDMQGAGTVTFGTALSSGTTTWTITSYQRVFN